MTKIGSIEKVQLLIVINTLLVLSKFWKLFINQVALEGSEIAWMIAYFITILFFSIPTVKTRYLRLLELILLLLIISMIGYFLLSGYRT